MMPWLVGVYLKKRHSGWGLFLNNIMIARDCFLNNVMVARGYFLIMSGDI